MTEKISPTPDREMVPMRRCPCGAETTTAACGICGRRYDESPPQVALLMRFHDRDAHDIVTLTDELPPFGVLQMAVVTWEAIGCPDEVLVSVAPTSGAKEVTA